MCEQCENRTTTANISGMRAVNEYAEIKRNDAINRINLSLQKMQNYAFGKGLIDGNLVEYSKIIQNEFIGF